jgi:predicted ATPase
LGENPNDRLLLFWVLYGIWAENSLAFDGDALMRVGSQFMSLASKQDAKAPLLLAHRIMGISLLYTGDFVRARSHLEQALALYDPAEHRPLATRFGQDTRVHALSYRSWERWFLGYPDAAIADAERAVQEGRLIAQGATLMNTLSLANVTHLLCGNYETASAQADELAALGDQKSSSFWGAFGRVHKGYVLASIGKAYDAVQTLTTALSALRSTGTTIRTPTSLFYLTVAYSGLGQIEDAWRCIAEALNAIETTKERWFEAEVHRMAGEVALSSPQPDIAKAEAYFERALAVAQKQQAKSWELRASMSLARLWRDQGKPQQARELLAPVYGWFTEGFDTRDLKEAKALLEELAA